MSVVVTCHDLGAYLGEAVSSVLGQTRPPDEVVVVDDASSDPATLEVLRGLSGPGLRVLRSDVNLGLPAARNLGIRATSGAYVCCVDADDVLEPAWLERASDVLRDRADVAFVTHWLKAFGDQQWDWTPQRCDLVTLLDANSVNGAALVRREVIEDVGLFDPAMRAGCEDWDLWIRVVRKGYRGWVVPEFMFRYRRRPGSMSRSMDHLALFRRLIEAHTPAYRLHLQELVQRRELAIADLERRTFDMEEVHHRDRLQRRARLRMELSAVRAKGDAIRRAERDAAQARETEAALERERETAAARAAEIAAGAEREAALARRVAEQEAQIAGERRQAEAMRASWSWRATAPVRRVLDWLRHDGR